MMSPPASISVLVVDDEEAILELVAEYLRARGMAVRTAADGDSALGELMKGDIDVVLTDLRLPVRGGMSLLEVIVERGLPVATVVMTGYGTIETVTQAFKMGTTDYLLKPVRLRDVHAALTQAVAQQMAIQHQRCARLANDLYETLLGLRGPQSDDQVLGRLAALVPVETGAEGCAIALRQGDAWCFFASGDAAASGPPMFESKSGDGSAVGLWLVGMVQPPPPREQARLQTLLDRVSAALSKPG